MAEAGKAGGALTARRLASTIDFSSTSPKDRAATVASTEQALRLLVSEGNDQRSWGGAPLPLE